MKRFSLLFLLFPVLLLAQTSWDGTADTNWYTDNKSTNTYTITTAEQLAGLAQLVNGGATFEGKTIMLSADIELAGNWTPIGDSIQLSKVGKPFRGIFDGNGKSISNVYVSDFEYAGLFGYVGTGGQIKNLVVNVTEINTSTTGNYSIYAGGLSGYYSSTKPIENCGVNIKDSIKASNGGGPHSYSGGLVGSVRESTILTINNSYVIGNVSSFASQSYSGFSTSGGLVGYAEGNSEITINNSYVTGNVSVTSNGDAYSGGLVGYSWSEITINNSYVTSYISSITTGGLAVSGGLVGMGTGIEIDKSYSMGDVFSSITSADYVNYYASSGGLVGRLAGGATISNSYSTGDVFSSFTSTYYHAYSGGLIGMASSIAKDITNSYAAGKITATGANTTEIYIGGIFGYCYSGLGENTSVYYNSDENPSSAAGDTIILGMSRTPAQLRTQNTFVGWDFENTWAMSPDINNGYPVLQVKTYINVAWDSITSFEYTGYEQVPTATATLPNGARFELVINGATNVGTHTATAKLAAPSTNYVLTNDTISFTINPKPLPENAIDPIENVLSTGLQIKPNITVRDGSKTLAENTDYEIDEYGENILGLGSVSIIGKGNYYGTATRNFGISSPTATIVPVQWNTQTTFTYNGTEQFPAATAEPHELDILGKQNEAGIYVAVAQMKNFDYNVYLANSVMPYKIDKKTLDITWSDDTIFVYNKMDQSPRASLAEPEPGVEFRYINRKTSVGKYKDGDAVFVQIKNQRIAPNYFLENDSKDYEIKKKDLNPSFQTILPDFEYKNDTLLVPSEAFSDSVTLQQILEEVIEYYGFATDTIRKETDDASVLKGKPKIKIEYDDKDGNSQGSKGVSYTPRYALAKRVETTQKATATIITDAVPADNYKLLDRSITIVATIDDEGGLTTFCKREGRCIALNPEICWFLGGDEVDYCKTTINHLPLITSHFKIRPTSRGIV
ncbi:MAG: hypothetical protein FWC26_12190 [Fibromonadales bacterium]|nr:hypothetical protein [Fibromonadales bacterium]